MADCTHRDQIQLHELPAQVAGCADCLTEGTAWLHLRICLACGHIGCCDDSPERHATKHWQQTGHALIRSLEPGETWSWCFDDQTGLRVEVAGETQIPPAPLA